MIYNLIEIIADRLRESLADLMPNSPEQHIVVGPISDPQPAALPLIVIYPTRFDICKHFSDTSSSQPRPQPIQQQILIDGTNPSGPYLLSHTPLKATARGRLTRTEGGASESPLMLVEDKDFEIDYQQPAILLKRGIPAAGQLLIEYAFAGVFVIREFQQDFLVNIYAAEMRLGEQWGSLLTAVILTNHDDLIEASNAQADYQTGGYSSDHSINQITLDEGVPDLSGTVMKYRFKFRVEGQVKLVKDIGQGFDTIKRIVSPGKTSDQAFDIDISVG